MQRVKREMSTMFADALLIVFISVCTALLAEGITWVLVYRTDKYKRLKAEVEKQSKKCKYTNILWKQVRFTEVRVHSILGASTVIKFYENTKVNPT